MKKARIAGVARARRLAVGIGALLLRPRRDRLQDDHARARRQRRCSAHPAVLPDATSLRVIALGDDAMTVQHCLRRTGDCTQKTIDLGRPMTAAADATIDDIAKKLLLVLEDPARDLKPVLVRCELRRTQRRESDASNGAAPYSAAAERIFFDAATHRDPKRCTLQPSVPVRRDVARPRLREAEARESRGSASRLAFVCGPRSRKVLTTEAMTPQQLRRSTVDGLSEQLLVATRLPGASAILTSG